MIKILFYIDELSAGGAEKVLCNLVNNMDPSSFDITVHTTWKSDAKSLLKPHVKYKYVFSERNKISRFIYRAETQLGLFYQLHLKGDYDIEVAYLECGPTKVMASSTNKKAVHIAWIHCDLEKKFTDMVSFANKTRNQYKKYDRVICVSEECNKTYQKYFSDCAPSQVLYNVIDDEEILRKAEMEPDIQIDKRKLTAVAVGRISPEKNYAMLLRVHHQLISEGYDHDLWLIGDGTEADRLKEYADNNLQDSVSFFGFQPNPYPYIKAADLIVCSSLYEGYSTVVVEAMILGTPVITVECGSGMHEILGESDYGVIVNNSEEDLKHGLIELLTKQERREHYRQKALERAACLVGNVAVKQTETCFYILLRRNNNA